LTKAPSDAARLTSTGQFIGTIDYVSPEQIQGDPATPASDRYALAAVLVECLTSEVPPTRRRRHCVCPRGAAPAASHRARPGPAPCDRRSRRRRHGQRPVGTPSLCNRAATGSRACASVRSAPGWAC
jgi:serine/threonine protein kinase